MVLRNANTGEFEAYDITNNQVTTANSLGRSGWIGQSASTHAQRRTLVRDSKLP
jgi:hypothetical protein